MVLICLNFPSSFSTTMMLVVPDRFFFLRKNICKNSDFALRVTLNGDAKIITRCRREYYKPHRKKVLKSGEGLFLILMKSKSCLKVGNRILRFAFMKYSVSIKIKNP